MVTLKAALGVAVIGVGLTLSQYADADPRLEVKANGGTFCHILNGNANNADDETFQGDCKAFVARNGTVANGRGIAVQKGVPYALLPHLQTHGVLVYPSNCPPRHIENGKCRPSHTVIEMTDADFNNQACTMVDSNNDTYTSNDWVTRITWKRGKVTKEVICYNGNQN